MNEGWRCPTCRRVYAPNHPSCDHCGPHAAPPCVPRPLPCVPPITPYRPYPAPNWPCRPYAEPYWSVLPHTVTVTSTNVCRSALEGPSSAPRTTL